jgi:hypothetical protein
VQDAAPPQPQRQPQVANAIPPQKRQPQKQRLPIASFDFEKRLARLRENGGMMESSKFVQEDPKMKRKSPVIAIFDSGTRARISGLWWGFVSDLGKPPTKTPAAMFRKWNLPRPKPKAKPKQACKPNKCVGSVHRFGQAGG